MSEQIPFLSFAAKTIIDEQTNLGDVHVVLPSRRACTYFMKYLGEALQTTAVAPKVITIEDFVNEHAGIETLDNVSLLLKLYKTFKRFDKDDDNNLERFTPLGMTILNDFSSIDKNLNESQAEELFEFVQESKALERWSDELGEDIDRKNSVLLKGYFGFWENLLSTYKAFRAELLQSNQAYSGLAFRIFYNQIEKHAQNLSYVYFLGVNQMTAVEEQIIIYLKKQGKAKVLIDTDTYYVDDNKQEAGHYTRRYLSSGMLDEDYSRKMDMISTKPLSVDTYEVSNSSTMVKLTGELLGASIQNDLGSKEFAESINHNAVLLPDESLLFPLMHALPQPLLNAQHQLLDEGKSTPLVNITMGVGLIGLPLYNLVDSLFSLQEALRDENGKPSYYHKPLVDLLRHPLIITEDLEVFRELIRDIGSQNLAYVPVDFVLDKLPKGDLWRPLFQPWGGKEGKAFEAFYRLLEILTASEVEKEESQFSHEFYYLFYTLLKKLENTLEKEKQSLSLRTLRVFLSNMMRSASVPFTGEPLSPIQVMGMLESRSLDFERIIIMSCNEGVMPKGKVQDSVIPLDIRVQYKLPIYSEHDSTYAYTLFRLFHQAKEVKLIYTRNSGTLGGGEKSRFLTQIHEELQNVTSVRVTHHEEALPIAKPSEVVMSIDKGGPNSELMQRLRKMLEKGKSPTTYINYLKNPYQFFVQIALKLDEQEEIEESLDYRTFGILLHNTLERCYLEGKAPEPERKGVVGKAIDSKEIYQWATEKRVQSILQEVKNDTEGLKAMQLNKGKNVILSEVAIRLIRNFLKLQSETEPEFFLVSQECFYGASFATKSLFSNHTLESLPKMRIAGQADRVQAMHIGTPHETLRIVDYKTGTYINGELKANHIEELYYTPNKSKIIQLLLYKYLLVRSLEEGKVEGLPQNFNPKTCRVESGFVFFRQIQDQFIPYTLADEPENRKDFLDYVERFVSGIGASIMDHEKPFTEDPPFTKEDFVETLSA